MNTLKPWITAALAAALVGTNAFAQSEPSPSAPPGMERGMGRSGAMNPERMFEGLDLTDAQRTELRTMTNALRDNIGPLREQMRAAQQTLAEANPGDADYDAKTAAARKTIQETRNQMRDVMQEFRSRTDAVLTPEQRTQIETRRAEMRGRMEERRSERRGDRGGGRRHRGG